MVAVIPPVQVRIDPATGASRSFSEHYIKRFGDVADIYQDQQAARSADPDTIAYEVYSNSRTGSPGELVFGTSILAPGRVGDEFAMTRGHAHQIVDRAEMYYGLAGAGVLLMEDAGGRTEVQPLTPGAVVYVPGGWIHRSVNVGDEPLVSLFCFAADAGQDYSVIDESGGMAMLVVTDGISGWSLQPNPAYRPRAVAAPAH